MLKLTNLPRNLLYEIAGYYPKIRMTFFCLDERTKKKVDDLDYFQTLVENMGISNARNMSEDELKLHLSKGNLPIR